MMKHLTLVLIALTVVFGSCSDDTSGPGINERLVFYPVGVVDGASQSDLGLWAISESGPRTRIFPGSAMYATGAANGGVVIAELQDSAAIRLMARCSNGTLVDVPQPVPSDVNRVFALSLPPHVTLGFDAHYAAYAGIVGPRAPSRDGSLQRLNLVRVSCADRTAALIDLHDSVVAAMRTQGAAAARAWGSQVLMDRAGGKIWIAVAGVSFPADFEQVVGYQIFGWTNGTVRALTEASASPYVLCAYDNIGNTVVYEHEGKIFSIVPGGKPKQWTLASGSIPRSSQAAVTKSRLAVFGADGIELRDPADGSLAGTVISYDSPVFTGYDTRTGARSIAISPDGDAIVFALQKTGSNNLRGMFMVQSDGGFVKLLEPGIASGAPVISDPLPRIVLPD